MKKKILLLISIFINIIGKELTIQSDVTIIGVAHAARSIGLHTKGFIDCLKNTVSITMLLSSRSSFVDLPPYIHSLVIDTSNLKTVNSPVVIFTDSIIQETPWQVFSAFKYTGLRIAFSWADQTGLEEKLVYRLNKYFDLIVVPDECLVNVYKKSGVKIPIFVLPEAIDLEPFLQLPQKTKRNEPFVFGCSAAYWPRKNHILLLQAFAQEFRNVPNVKLKIHGRWGEGYTKLKKMLHELRLNNVEIIEKVMTRQEYIDFFASLDCYILLSRGEAFSITPREALAAGIPCIISDNTAHGTIVKSGFVSGIKSTVMIPQYSGTGKKIIGYQFDCNIMDARNAMRDVYMQYHKHLAKAQQGRIWVQQYLPYNLNKRYQMLVKPKTVSLGTKNKLIKHGIITNNKALYEKYKKLIKKYRQ